MALRWHYHDPDLGPYRRNHRCHCKRRRGSLPRHHAHWSSNSVPWVRPAWGNDGNTFATSLSVRQIGVRYGFEDDECNFADSLSDRPLSAIHTGHDLGTRDIRCSHSGRCSKTAAQRRPDYNSMPGSYTTGLPQLRFFAYHACHDSCPRCDHVELSNICPVS